MVKPAVGKVHMHEKVLTCPRDKRQMTEMAAGQQSSTARSAPGSGFFPRLVSCVRNQVASSDKV